MTLNKNVAAVVAVVAVKREKIRMPNAVAVTKIVIVNTIRMMLTEPIYRL